MPCRKCPFDLSKESYIVGACCRSSDMLEMIEIVSFQVLYPLVRIFFSMVECVNNLLG